MRFYQVFLRNVKVCYTWHALEYIPIGSRVEVVFRNRKKIGIVVAENTESPTFKTQPIQKVLPQWPIDTKYIELIKQISPLYFVDISKFLNLMIPEEFLKTENPVKTNVFYTLAINPANATGKKQKEVLKLFENQASIKQDILLETASKTVLNNMVKKSFLIENQSGINIPKLETFFGENFDLTPLQKQVFASIQSSKKPSVLWGVTGSGKTEIYKNLAKDTHGQTLLLLPEIALTPQLIGQFQAIFGQNVGVWHSKLSRREKIQTWARLQSGDIKILIGTRSSTLIPIPNLSLIILDEEHEWTFKNEFAPRYWTHDLAQKLSQATNSKLVFGSATPRVESLAKCKNGDWNLVELFETVHQTNSPKFRIIDLKQEQKKGNYSPLSESLVKQITKTIAAGEQAVLFLNKRGYAGASMCKSCGEYFECPDCSQNMKFHTNGRQSKLVCHICGHLQKFPSECPHCQAKDFLFKGWGTQQVEQAVLEQIPNAKVLRADADSVKGKHDFKNIWQDFKDKKANVLIGTQMIAKGLDFESVTLVGLILADVGLSLPDFRAQERVFQLLSQVSGRAGRRKKQGTIVLQTFHPDEDVFKFLIQNKYSEFYEQEISNRKKFELPPFSAFGKITVSDQNKHKAFTHAQMLHKLVQEKSEKKSEIVSVHMAPAFFPRSHNRYHFHVFIQATNEPFLREFLNQHLDIFHNVKIDINPSSLL